MYVFLSLSLSISSSLPLSLSLSLTLSLSFSVSLYVSIYLAVSYWNIIDLRPFLACSLPDLEINDDKLDWLTIGLNK